MHGNGKLVNTYTVYEVYVYKTQAITYLYGHDWRKFAFDYGLKKGDELRIRNSNGQIYVTAYRVGDTSKYIICNFFLLISFDNCILSSCSKPFPLF